VRVRTKPEHKRTTTVPIPRRRYDNKETGMAVKGDRVASAIPRSPGGLKRVAIIECGPVRGIPDKQIKGSAFGNKSSSPELSLFVQISATKHM
jgi:hypothetical protein